MKRDSIRIGLALLLTATAAYGFGDDRQLIARAPAARQDAAPRAAQRDEKLASAENIARIDLALAEVRLGLVLARKDLNNQRMTDAARRAQRVLSTLAGLSEDLDAEVYMLQAEGILARAAQAGVDLDAIRREAKFDQADFGGQIDDQARVAAEIGRQFDGADTVDIDTVADADELRRRTLQRQVPDEWGYRPSRELIRVHDVLERDRQRLFYQGALRKAYQHDAVRMLTAGDEARLAPTGEVAYPDDWPERVARRAQYEGGQIARSDSWTDKDGREWYVAVYDIHDLIYVPPNFQPPVSNSLTEDLRNNLDRQYLRERSEIFGGYAEDLAYGIPLLRYFGGVDDYLYRGPKYSIERQQQIIEMIKAFTEQHSEAKIIPLAPADNSP